MLLPLLSLGQKATLLCSIQIRCIATIARNERRLSCSIYFFVLRLLFLHVQINTDSYKTSYFNLFLKYFNHVNNSQGNFKLN